MKSQIFILFLFTLYVITHLAQQRVEKLNFILKKKKFVGVLLIFEWTHTVKWIAGDIRKLVTNFDKHPHFGIDNGFLPKPEPTFQS